MTKTVTSLLTLSRIEIKTFLSRFLSLTKVSRDLIEGFGTNYFLFLVSSHFFSLFFPKTEVCSQTIKELLILQFIKKYLKPPNFGAM